VIPDSRRESPLSPADVRIVSTSTDEHIAGFNRCVDAVARERRWLRIVEGFPLQSSATFVRSMLAAGGVHLVAVNGAGEVVGWCDISRRDGEGPEIRGRLGMGLLSGYRGRGIGERLARAAIEEARAKGMTRVELEVFATNARAYALYDRLGFRETGRQPSGREIDGAPVDDIMMALPLGREGS